MSRTVYRCAVSGCKHLTYGVHCASHLQARPRRRPPHIPPPERPVYSRGAPDCPTCNTDQHVVIYRRAGIPWYGGPWKPEAWRCVSCHRTWVAVLAAAGTAG